MSAREPSAVGSPRSRPPVLGSHRTLMRTFGVIFVLAGTLGVPAVLATASPQARVVAATLVIGSMLIGIVLIGFAARLPSWLAHPIAVLGMTMLAVNVHQIPEPTYAVANSTGAIMVGCIALFFGWRTTLAHQLIAAVLIVGALGLRSVDLIVPGLVVSGVGIGVGVVVGMLVRLARRSMVDETTGLLNRRGLEQPLEESLTEAGHSGQPLTVVVIDIDGFKQVNQAVGVDTGDQALRDFGRLLDSVFVPPAQLGRTGGDEFLIAWPGSPDSAVSLLDDVRGRASMSFCAGVSGLHAGDSVSVLLARAEAALYTAKRTGRSRVMVRSDEGSRLGERLRAALLSGQVSVHYQPIVDLVSSRVTGVEALARWDDGGVEVSPAEFIPVAEDEGLIADLGRYVMARAVADVVRLRAVTGLDLFVSVNASGKEIIESAFVGDIADALSGGALPAERLIIEVTESTMEAQSPLATGSLRRVRRLGVRVALDDFGTGYSSLSRLHTLPVDLIKLDRSFVTVGDRRLLLAVARFGESLGLPVVAEGVSQADHEALVREAGIGLVQGWRYLPATPVDELADWIITWSRREACA